MPLENPFDLCYPKCRGDCMRIKNARFTIMLAMVVALFFVGARESSAAPKIQVDQAVYDAGSVVEGRELSHEFVLRNEGDRTLSFKIKPC